MLREDCLDGAHFALRVVGRAHKDRTAHREFWRLRMLFQLSSLRLAVVLALVCVRISWFLEETPSLVLGERRPAHLREMFAPSSFAYPGNSYLVTVVLSVKLLGCVLLVLATVCHGESNLPLLCHLASGNKKASQDSNGNKVRGIAEHPLSCKQLENLQLSPT